MSLVPNIVFIVPYRDRETQRQFYDKHMRYIMEDAPRDSWKVIYIHQEDGRSFNRGAMKNIGFLIARDKWPNEYRDITLVFNDVDIMPIVKGFIQYETTQGVVKHFYGFRHTLGGIVSIKGGDYEKTGGFPNFWAWGYEDNMFQYRVIKNGLTINRDAFSPIYNKNYIMLHDGLMRDINKQEYDVYKKETAEGFQNIVGLQYSEDYTLFPEGSIVINVSGFNTGRSEAVHLRKAHDLRNGSRPFMAKKRVVGMNFS